MTHLSPSHLAELHTRLKGLISDEELVLKIMVEVQETLGRPSFSEAISRQGLREIEIKGKHGPEDVEPITEQRERFLTYLKKHPEGVTIQQVWEETGIPPASQSPRRSDLRKAGYKVKGEKVPGKRVYRYRLAPESGTMETPKVFDRALTPDEIMELFLSPSIHG